MKNMIHFFTNKTAESHSDYETKVKLLVAASGKAGPQKLNTSLQQAE